MDDNRTAIAMAVRSSIEHKGKGFAQLLIKRSLHYLKEKCPMLQTTTFATLRYPMYRNDFGKTRTTKHMKEVRDMVSVKCMS